VHVASINVCDILRLELDVRLEIELMFFRLRRGVVSVSSAGVSLVESISSSAHFGQQKFRYFVEVCIPVGLFQKPVWRRATEIDRTDDAHKFIN
jgi:hypothetical protein